MAGTALLNPVTAKFKGANSVDVPHLLRALYIELRTMNTLLAAGLNQEPLLDQIRADPTTVMPNAQNVEYNDAYTYTPDPTD